MNDPNALIAEDCGRLAEYPLEWVMYAFPWLTDKSIQKVKLTEPYASRFPNCEYGPDVWICEELDAWGEHIRAQAFDGKNPVASYQSAITSGHGIGKSTATAWIILFIMSTRPNCKGTVTAGTSDQLRTKTWAELGKWLLKCITRDWFKFSNSKGNMTIRHKEHPETWRCDAYTCREENSESFAGQHAADSTPFYIFDEASAIPNVIWDVAEGGKTDGEPVHFAFGNPTRNTGEFRECFRKKRHRWRTRHVDSRNVQITNKDKIQEFIDDYGESSDFVKVRVRGQFPSQSVMQFISEEDVDAAFGKHLRPQQYDFAPVIISCDPAWTGEDELVIAMRQGLMFQILHRLPKNDNDVEVAQLIMAAEDKYKADAVFIDMGYGTGIYSVGKTLGRVWRLVAFGSKSSNEGFYLKRSEMWGLVKAWLKEGGALPPEDLLRQDLTSPETVPRIDGKIQLESKKDMKKRGLPSPNIADALALTFAYPVTKKNRNEHLQSSQSFANTDWRPY